MFYAQQCASWHRFLRSAEPDIHLQSRAPKSLHRRLSLCSLPVPKQFVESLGRVISFAQSATCRTWQSAHFVHPVSFGSILCRRSPAFFRRHEVSLLPIHGKQICDHLALQQVSPDCYFLFANFRFADNPLAIERTRLWVGSNGDSACRESTIVRAADKWGPPQVRLRRGNCARSVRRLAAPPVGSDVVPHWRW
jgi:hypothetical protein